MPLISSKNMLTDCEKEWKRGFSISLNVNWWSPRSQGGEICMWLPCHCRMKKWLYSSLQQELCSKGNAKIPCNLYFSFLRKYTTHEYSAESNSPTDSKREAEVSVHNSEEEQAKSLTERISPKLYACPAKLQSLVNNLQGMMMRFSPDLLAF